jgi:hypothetical protein
VSHDEITCKKLILEYLVDYEDGSMPEATGRSSSGTSRTARRASAFSLAIAQRAGPSAC